MRAILFSLLAAATIAVAAPASVSPASAQLRIETPVGGVRVGTSERRYRDHDRRGYRHSDRRGYGAYGYSRGRGGDNCSVTIVRRSDGSTTRIRRCR